MNEDFMWDNQGRLVPKEIIEPIDLLRDDTVKRLIEAAKIESQKIKDFKTSSLEDIVNFIQISAKEYGAEIGGKKGNVTLMSYDGKYKVVRSQAEYIVFDERLQVAKELIDECINDWAKDANNNIKALVNHAFQTDKEGRVSTSRILGLRRLKIDDENWQRAMRAITDSQMVNNTKSYIRFYERIDNTDRYKSISLDIANI